MRPSLRRAATVAAVTLGALTLGASGLGAPSLGAAGPSGTAGAQAERVTSEQVEEDLAWLINQRRAQAGLAPLLLAPTVRAPARRWAEAQAAAGKISHRADLSPYPATVPGLAWSLTGENVGHAGSARSGGPAIMTALDQAFYDSPTHRDNVLGPYTHLAVGAVDDGRDLYVTVAFVDWNGASVDGQRLPTSALHDTVGALDSVGGEEGGGRRVGGVAAPDAAPTAEVTIDGRARTVAPTEVRPDLASVAGAAPDLANGLNTLLPAPPGPTEVCVDGPPVGFGAGLSLGCRNVLVPQGWDGLVGAGDDAATVGYVASGLLPGAERPAKPTGEPGTTAQPGTSAKPAGGPEAAHRPTWGTHFPAPLQRHRADGGGGRSPGVCPPVGRPAPRGAGARAPGRTVGRFAGPAGTQTAAHPRFAGPARQAVHRRCHEDQRLPFARNAGFLPGGPPGGGTGGGGRAAPRRCSPIRSAACPGGGRMAPSGWPGRPPGSWHRVVHRSTWAMSTATASTTWSCWSGWDPAGR